MSRWTSSNAAKVFGARLRNGCTIESQKGSCVILEHSEGGSHVWAFHDAVEIGRKVRSRIAKHTGLQPEDL